MATGRKHATPASTAADPREEFLDIAGHELRTPITALKGHVQLLQRRLRKQEGRDADLAELDKMVYQIERISHQLDVYLSASHIVRDKFAVTRAEMDLVAVVRRIVSIYAAGISGHTIQLQLDDDQIRGEWDRRRVEEAVSALLNNAVKYSPGGTIIVHLERSGDSARVEVHDPGIGVPAAERHNIFAAYSHGSNVENAGAGLGLHVAREAVRRQGGRIGVRARPGGGSIFWFTLPLMPTPTTHPKRRPQTVAPAQLTSERA